MSTIARAAGTIGHKVELAAHRMNAQLTVLNEVQQGRHRYACQQQSLVAKCD